MKLVIEQKGVKRSLVGDFCLCASREDLESLKTQIENRLKSSDFVMAWMDIRDPLPTVPNTTTKEWSE